MMTALNLLIGKMAIFTILTLVVSMGALPISKCFKIFTVEVFFHFRFAPRKFFLEVIVNEIPFPSFFFNIFSLVYKDTDFCVMVLYPSILLSFFF